MGGCCDLLVVVRLLDGPSLRVELEDVELELDVGALQVDGLQRQ
jgi:hypothetical protein